jgi:hypothetical protein
MRWFDADKHRKVKYSRGSAALPIGTSHAFCVANGKNTVKY